MGETYVPLTETEIDDFFDDLDSDKDGYVTFDELEAKFHKVRDELVPNLQKHRPLHPSYSDVEQQDPDTGNTLHTFLCYIMPECGAKLSRIAYTRLVQSWEVPSQKQNDLEDIDKAGREIEHHTPRRRQLYAYWAVRGPEILFITCVVLCMTSFGTWQMVIYMQNQPVRQALGWGVILAKTCTGVLYPTLIFMLLSTSRHLSTWIRYYSYPMSRTVNWDYSQKFHIIMNCAGLFFATLHAIGHLVGSMIWITSPAHRPAVSNYFGTVDIPQSYIVPLRSLPGWTGVVALGLFWTIALFSLPWLRKRSYEIYQCGHLLMFPMIGLLCAHGTSARLQAPMLGYFLALPSLLVIYERVNRFVCGCIKVPATMEVLDNDAVTIICKHPSGKAWRFSAGQYVLLQVPRVSFFQWHPFTISKCRGSELQVHIKMEGDWTRALWAILAEGENFYVGIDGPFGAPAQRFYNFDYSIVIGGGIGITPFAAIFNDLEESFKEHRDPWKSHCSSRSVSYIRLPTPKPVRPTSHKDRTTKKESHPRVLMR